MNKILSVLLLLVLGSSFTRSAEDTCKVGIYINSLTDFNISDQSFSSDFWMWFNYKNDSLQFNDALEVTNSKSSSFTNYSKMKKDGINWDMMKFSAVVFKEWDVSSFPFDKQKLTLHIDHTIYDTKKLAFITDAGNSAIDSNLLLSNWKIDSLAFYVNNQTYNTTFGDPVIKGSSTYPSVTADIFLTRENSWNTLFKMLTGVYVAFSIVLLAFFVKPSDRLGLCVGGLFAAVGNKYIIESVVPSTVSNTLFDNIHNITFIAIFVILVVAVISFKWNETEKPEYLAKAKKLDRLSFYSVSIIYISLNAFLIMRAAG
ncbi:MAG TPA: hypothetical protein PKE39_01030 [Ignavibacteria bacterium]|nr:hypothetical protein [Ignavibacteria bacterium]HMQ97579.1 hypothetical protein [Ignavibacteria bacterium]